MTRRSTKEKPARSFVEFVAAPGLIPFHYHFHDGREWEQTGNSRFRSCVISNRFLCMRSAAAYMAPDPLDFMHLESAGMEERNESGGRETGQRERKRNRSVAV